MLMAEFFYNNTKNTNIGHSLCELNYGFYPQVLYKKDINPYSKYCFANKLVEELKELIKICCQNLLYI